MSTLRDDQSIRGLVARHPVTTGWVIAGAVASIILKVAFG